MKSNSKSKIKKEWESVSEGCSWTKAEKDVYKVIVAYIYLYVMGEY